MKVFATLSTFLVEMKCLETKCNIFCTLSLFNNSNSFKFRDYYEVANKSRRDFDMETGYKDNADVNTYPIRALASGADDSLIVIFQHDPLDTDFTCTGLFHGYR